MSMMDSDEEGISLGSADDDDEFSLLDEDDELRANIDNKAVACLRGSVIAVLAASAILISVIVHQATTTANNGTNHQHGNSEMNRFSNFEQAYAQISDEFVTNFHRSLGRTITALDNFAWDLQTYVDMSQKRGKDDDDDGGDDDGDDNNESDAPRWPTVTFPDFDRRASNALELAGGNHAPILSSMMLVPLLQTTTDDYEGLQQQQEQQLSAPELSRVVQRWENYSIHHQDWLFAQRQPAGAVAEDTVDRNVNPMRPRIGGHEEIEGLYIRRDSTTGTSTSRFRRRSTVRRKTKEYQQLHQQQQSISSRIFNASGPCDDGLGPFAPLWQTYPVVDGLIEWVNFDLLSMRGMFAGSMNAIVRSRPTQSGTGIVLGEICNLRPYDPAADAAGAPRQQPAQPQSPFSIGDKDGRDGTLARFLERQSRRRDINGIYAVNGGDADATAAVVVDPLSPLVYPIVQQQKQRGVTEQTANKNGVVSFVTTMLSWRSLLTESAPSNSEGMTVVIQNDKCGDGSSSSSSGGGGGSTSTNSQYLTFRVGNHLTNDNDGVHKSASNMLQYLGEGDLHDPHFTNMNKTFVIGKSGSSAVVAETAAFSPTLDDEYCPYRITLYPSHDMYDRYRTVSSVTYTVAVLLVFAFATMIFIAYDFLVERRQKVVMDRALQSTAIVSSLFPETVRDRLFRRGSISEPGYVDDCSLTVDETPNSSDNNNNPNNANNTNNLNHHNMNDNDMLHAAMMGAANHGGGGGGGIGANGGSMMNNTLASRDSFIMVQPAKMRLKTFLTDEQDAGPNGKPIADLFPHCTVLFADISGFTAWSSVRDPAQVFTLLESVYQAFDRIARKRGVFKVETIGDSYVAVTGLPEPQDDHALIMARFARDCRYRMTEVTRKLEVTLGPDTGDLRMRFGLHSGPVTAGVLRGEKSRFQLFGDTVNTAARMESTGERDKIQVSSSTAEQLREAGKGHWLQKRDRPVVAKGKGELQTYWLEYRSRRNSTGENSRCSISSIDSRVSIGETRSDHENLGQSKSSLIWGAQEEIPDATTQRTKHQRLIDYNCDLLAQLLKQVIARRRVLEMAGRRCSQGGLPPNLESHSGKVQQGTVLEEVTEVIKLPHFNPKACKGHVDPESIDLGPVVEDQLKRYVTIIAAMYRNNPFHNFEHASHVTMSVNKLLQRVVTPDITFKRRSMQMTDRSFKKQVASDLHNYTYGITSDPLTQFAVVFSALIHDLDHWGVSNAQLVKEGVPIAEKYNNKSVAEQNSVDLAWDLLMDEGEFGELQQCIFPTDGEFKRFRQVVVNVVMATDIFDKELSDLRKNRWEKAFAQKDGCSEPDPDDEHRKATIVIEHIMQASDVSHAMQHWHVYQKWNRRLFDELYTAYRAGRMGADPSTFWYHGELKFFDTYIIPLARKLKECGVFGVASDECLNYAMDNRKEWEAKGEQIVVELVANYQQREREEAEALEEASVSKRKRSRFCRRRSLITTGG